MALNNAQHSQLMQIYEQRQLENRQRLQKRFEEVYAAIPTFRALEDAIASSNVEKARLLLDGDASALDSLKETLADLLAQKQTLLSNAGFPAHYLEPDFFCDSCKDTGYIGTTPCHCLKKETVRLLYTQSNLQDFLERENFSTFSLGFYSPNLVDPLTGRSAREAAVTALQTCQDFVRDFSDTFQNLLLYGSTGTGKTFLSHCIAKEVMESSHSVVYLTSTELFDLLADHTFRQGEKETSSAYDQIYDCDLLIIDDLGTEFTNSFTASQLFICLNERILRRRSTVISTNLALGDIKETYSERTFSRISSHYTILRLTGDDIRIQKKLLQSGGTNHATS